MHGTEKFARPQKEIRIAGPAEGFVTLGKCFVEQEAARRDQ